MTNMNENITIWKVPSDASDAPCGIDLCKYVLVHPQVSNTAGKPEETIDPNVLSRHICFVYFWSGTNNGPSLF